MRVAKLQLCARKNSRAARSCGHCGAARGPGRRCLPAMHAQVLHSGQVQPAIASTGLLALQVQEADAPLTAYCLTLSAQTEAATGAMRTVACSAVAAESAARTTVTRNIDPTQTRAQECRVTHVRRAQSRPSAEPKQVVQLTAWQCGAIRLPSRFAVDRSHRSESKALRCSLHNPH